MNDANERHLAMSKWLAAALVVALPLAAQAEQTSLIDTASLPKKQVYGAADLTPLAVSAKGAPVVVLLEVKAGVVVPPHAAKSGLRLLTVLKGEMSWGDGSVVDRAKESIYPSGTILTVPAGVDHWLAARSGDLRLQVVVLDDETPVPAVRKQMR